MKLHFLRYFVVLAEELHFGRAAERLAITQPPLSTAIKSLEDELQVQLFVRDNKHVKITPAGMAYLDEARHVLNRLDRAVEVAKMAASGMRGRLEVGVTGSLIYREVPQIVRAFNAEMPDVFVVLKEMSTAEQLDELARGRLEVGFLNAGSFPAELESVSLRDDDFVLCIPDSHPKANHASLNLRDFAKENFVMFSREVAPANHDNVIAIFAKYGIHPKTVHAARQWLTIIAMVANGLGVSIVPKSLARSNLQGVRFSSFKGATPSSPASLVWNPLHISSTVTAFINTAKTTIDKLR